MAITNKELEMLKILWQSKRPMNVSDIKKANEKMVISTIQSSMRKLLKQELIEVAEITHSGTVLARKYVPTISQESFVMKQFPTLSISELIKELIQTGNFEESEELDALIEKLVELKKM